ncbi:MAG: hypothetical protein VB048_00110 [Bacteroidaceae bacterium]|jgi:hypothetical protein|nr:hypothetical protein [Bacteroidales bacterium]MDY4789660.1 hypothetical protein [Bacteroidales bacterium]MEA4966507.1 hypothetical protein [Bacteroidaceae bacterium]MEA5100650.1 hypothetical protein [Bacteroidales bacterium]NCC18215.1 hypothetical protein [Bacteroidia bacterium]
MKKVFFLAAVLFCISLVSCTQNDCVCTANQEKSTSSANSNEYPVYDWGGNCSSITQNDIPELSSSSTEYNLDCTDL